SSVSSRCSYCYVYHLALHSFPTRRSSDLFEGKQDLEKRLPIRLRAWQNPDARFIVMRDQDSGDCVVIKQGLVNICSSAGHPNALDRKSTRLNSSHVKISYAVFCLKKKK